jgi:hypothetical protein
LLDWELLGDLTADAIVTTEGWLKIFSQVEHALDLRIVREKATFPRFLLVLQS